MANKEWIVLKGVNFGYDEENGLLWGPCDVVEVGVRGYAGSMVPVYKNYWQAWARACFLNSLDYRIASEVWMLPDEEAKTRAKSIKRERRLEEHSV